MMPRENGLAEMSKTVVFLSSNLCFMNGIHVQELKFHRESLRASAIDSNFRVSERTDYRKIRPVADNECKNENGNPRNKNG